MCLGTVRKPVGLGPHEPEENRRDEPGQNLDLRCTAACGFHDECDGNLCGFQTDE